MKKVLLLISTLVLIFFPPALLKFVVNKEGETFSPVIRAQTKKVFWSLSPFGMKLEETEVTFKKSGHVLATVKHFSYEVFKNMFVIDGLKLNVTSELLKHLQEILIKRPKARAFYVPRVINGRLIDSEILIALVKDAPFSLKNVHGEIQNLRLKEAGALMKFELGMNLTRDSKFHTEGKVNPLNPLSRWDIDAEMKDVRVTFLNEILKGKMPLTFDEGQVSFYLEAVKDGPTLHGYVKPMFKNVVAKNSHEEMNQPFFLKVISSMAFDEDHATSLGIKVPFKLDKMKLLQIDAKEAWDTFFTEAKDRKIKDGLDHELKL